MLKAGISLSSSLKTLAKQTTNKKFAKTIIDISNNVEKGVSFTESLRPHEKIFGQLFINMIESGELSGKLEEVLKQLFIQIKKQHELISKVKGALTYPTVILFAMIGIGIFMMIVVVPKITNMFKDLNTELPLATKILINVSNSLATNGIAVLIGTIIFIFILAKILKTAKGKYAFEVILFKTPVFSSIIKKINLAKFARTISSLLKTDIMIIKTFQITANVTGNLHYRRALIKMSQEIQKGGSIHKVVEKEEKLFPPVVSQMIAIGEETGEIDTILEELAEFYEGEVREIMNSLPSIIEPILMIVLGVVVGAMAVAIVMPMYSLTSTV
jgi:type IV pilus assembly protein PilC